MRSHSKCYTGANITIWLPLTEVQFGWVLIGSTKLSRCLNPGLDLRFGSCLGVNFGPDFGQVRKSSGSNFGSGPNCGITNRTVYGDGRKFDGRCMVRTQPVTNPYP
jgi:hypothetical protein